MGNDQKPRCLSQIVIEPHNLKILPFFPHGYHTPQLKDIAISPMAFSPQNFKILPTLHLEFLWVGNPTFFVICRNYVSIIIAVISNIIVLVSHNVI